MLYSTVLCCTLLYYTILNSILYYTILYTILYTIYYILYTIYYTILYYTKLYSILYYTILYYTILYYTILYYTILYYTILYYTILYYTILYYTILYYTILYYTILYYFTPDYTILCYSILYYTILYSTILYYTILYYTRPDHTILYFYYYTILLHPEKTDSVMSLHIPQRPASKTTKRSPVLVSDDNAERVHLDSWTACRELPPLQFWVGSGSIKQPLLDGSGRATWSSNRTKSPYKKPNIAHNHQVTTKCAGRLGCAFADAALTLQAKTMSEVKLLQLTCWQGLNS